MRTGKRAEPKPTDRGTGISRPCPLSNVSAGFSGSCRTSTHRRSWGCSNNPRRRGLVQSRNAHRQHPGWAEPTVYRRRYHPRYTPVPFPKGSGRPRCTLAESFLDSSAATRCCHHRQVESDAGVGQPQRRRRWSDKPKVLHLSRSPSFPPPARPGPRLVQHQRGRGQEPQEAQARAVRGTH